MTVAAVATASIHTAFLAWRRCVLFGASPLNKYDIHLGPSISCFRKLRVLFVVVLSIKAVLFRAYKRPPLMFGNSNISMVSRSWCGLLNLLCSCGIPHLYTLPNQIRDQAKGQRNTEI